MIFEAIVAVLAAAQGPPPETRLIRKPVPEGRLEIPDEIAPAVMPYVGCLVASSGVEVRGSYDPRPRGVGRGADCSPYRQEAARNAERLLARNGRRSREERARLIDRTLSSIDSFHRVTSSPRPEKDDSDAQN